MNHHPFEPDYAVPPGCTLRETMTALGLTKRLLAEASGLSEKYLDGILAGQSAITCHAANRLEEATGVPSHLWFNLEVNYQAQVEAGAHVSQEAGGGVG